MHLPLLSAGQGRFLSTSSNRVTRACAFLRVTVQTQLGSQAALPKLQSFRCVSITLTVVSHLLAVCLIFPSTCFCMTRKSFIPLSSFLFASEKLISGQLSPTTEM